MSSEAVRTNASLRAPAATTTVPASIMDLCIHIVRQDFGIERANAVARGLIMPPHRDGGQSQFIPQPVPESFEASRLGKVIERMQSNIAFSHPVEELAVLAGMSLRTFQRRFEALTGLPPSTWLLRERLRLACALLEQKREYSLEQIAQHSGFGTMPTMRHHFRSVLQTTPSNYRRAYAGRGQFRLGAK